jgi:isoleucyl-tRNA synthetase
MTLEEKKIIEKKAAKNIAQYELQKTDWYVTRQAETGTPIPAAIATHRAALRDKCNAIETAVNACVTEEDFNALFEIPMDDEGNFTGYAVIENWPTLEE